jgi:hypothetical protein
LRKSDRFGQPGNTVAPIICARVGGYGQLTRVAAADPPNYHWFAPVSPGVRQSYYG